MFYEPLKKKHTILLGGDFVKTKDPPIYVLGYYDENEDIFYYLLKNSICSYPLGGHKRVVVERFTKTQARDKVAFNAQWGTSEELLRLKPILYVEFRRMIKTNNIITIDSIEQWRAFCDLKDDPNYPIEIMRKIFNID